MLMMRLQRVGRKNDPSYRLVVVDKRTGPKSNKNIDILGSYNPKFNRVEIDAPKVTEWLSKGVQPSDTVHNILVGQKVIEGKKVNVLPKKSPIVDESEAAGSASDNESAPSSEEISPEGEETQAEAVPAEAGEEAAAETAADETTSEEPVEGKGEAEAPEEQLKAEEVTEASAEEAVPSAETEESEAEETEEKKA